MGGSHGHATGDSDRGRRALWIALGLNTGFLGAEVAGGLAFGSLALLADAAHMGSDVVGLVVALVAERLSRRPATKRHSFGWRRAEVLGALANAVTLLVVVGWIVIEAIRRLPAPQPVEGGPVLLIAAIGLGVNAGSAVVLMRVAGRNLNLRGAFLHMVADAAGSAGVIVAAIVVIGTGAEWADPAVSLLIAGLILWSTWKLLRGVVLVLLEATPPDLDPDSVAATLAADDAVDGVHHLHLWSVASNESALSAHLVLAGAPTLHEAQAAGDRLKDVLHHRYNITHSTLELECHPCPQPAGGCGPGETTPRRQDVRSDVDGSTRPIIEQPATTGGSSGG
jgi:cobalt-zinc-cadmium efflux system protein